MKSQRFVGVVAGCALLWGCAGGRSSATNSPTASSQPGFSAPAPETKSAPTDDSAPEPPPPAEASAELGRGEGSGRFQGPSGAPAKAPRSSAFEPERRMRDAEERPGLGTSWGETRVSHVSTERFVRRNGDRPFAVASLFYNDAEGVRAMARRAGISEFDTGTLRVAGGALTVRLLDEQGQALPALEVGGRTHFIGTDGERYTIQLENNTGDRLEAVATVDGLDVIDGRAGSFSKRGYLIAPFSTVEIDGFRRSNDVVAAFRFGSVSDSYAARKGNDRNVGVIGVAVFQEAGSRLPWTDREVERRNTADPFPGRFATPPSVIR